MYARMLVCLFALSISACDCVTIIVAANTDMKPSDMDAPDLLYVDPNAIEPFVSVTTCKIDAELLCVVDYLPETTINLSDNTNDWVHFGLNGEHDVNRKVGINLLSAYEVLGADKTTHQYRDNYSSFIWADGSPTVMATANYGIYVQRKDHGFAVTAPAGPDTNIFEVYMSAFGADYMMTAYMTDNPSNVLTIPVVTTYNRIYRKYVFIYRSKLPGQTLNISWLNTNEHASVGMASNVTLQATTLKK